MEQETYMLPVRCKGCNTIFDLWQILQEQEKARVFLADNHFAKLLNQSFCPTCRKAILMGMNTETGEMGDDSDQEEYEMMLEF